nr:MAG TPA: hypothetical protein [Caudoviricetes sp.]
MHLTAWFHRACLPNHQAPRTSTECIPLPVSVYLIPPPLNGATARLMRRGEAYMRFPLRLSHRIGRPVHRQTRQFSAG